MRPQPLRALALVALLFLGALRLAAATYHVAPGGNDRNPGTLARPFATIQRAHDAAGPGDTVLLRGGTYAVTEAQIAQTSGIWAFTFRFTKSGTEKAPIRFWAYPGETPVFNFSAVKPADRRVVAFRVEGDWLHFRGIQVVGVQVTIRGHTQSMCFDNRGSHNVYERLSLHDGQAIGVWIGAGSHNLVLNCDAYRNHDFTSEDGRGGNVDGFGFHGAQGSTGNVFRGCRAWFNSDDGYDCINAAESVTFENCWAFYNGYAPDFKKLADGNGFKAGGYGSTPVARLPAPIPRNVVRGCLAVRNKANGFYANHHPGGGDWFNNTALRNGANFNFLCRLPDNVTDVPGYGHVIRNNVSYDGRDVVELDTAKSTADHNSFDLAGLVVTAADFAGLDEALLTAPRKPDGSLPDIAFARPAPRGKLIDRGVDIGRPFTGKAPDLGAFESR